MISLRCAAGARLIAASIAVVAGCTEIPTSDTAVLAISVNPTISPSIVLGDTLRDTTGKAVPLSASVYNYNGSLVTSAAVRFHAADRGIVVDSTTGFVVGDSLRDTPARAIVSVGSLQAFQPLLVTLRPDTVVAVNGRDSLAYSLLDSTKNISPALSVKVRHSLTSTDSAVKNYLVSFAIISPADTLLARLVNDANAASKLDTTDSNGEAARKIKVRPDRLTSLNDSIIVNATVRYKGQVRGSPVRLVLKVKPGT